MYVDEKNQLKQIVEDQEIITVDSKFTLSSYLILSLGYNQNTCPIFQHIYLRSRSTNMIFFFFF